MAACAPSAAAGSARACARAVAVLIFVLLGASNAGAAAEQRSASATLRAKWSGTPLLQEAAELLADDDIAKFWSFVETSFAAPPLPSEDGAACWTHVLNLTTSLLSPSWAKLAPLVLASRKYSAKLAVFQQALEQDHADVKSCCFANVNGIVATTPEDLAKAVEQAASGPGLQLLPEDHVYPADAVLPSAVNAVLYAPVGAACAAPLHAALKAAATSGTVVYAIRPTLAKTCSGVEGTCVQAGGASEPLLLPGWGLEATITGDAADSKQVASLKDLGLQATQRVLKASDPLAKLVDVAQNLPSQVTSLVKQEVNSTLRQAVTHNQQYIGPSTSFMLLNGLSVNIEDLDYFGLLDRLQSEAKLVDQLSALGVQAADAQQLLQMRADDASASLASDVRLDLGTYASGEHTNKVLWLNDLEVDVNYGRFSRKISDLVKAPSNQLNPMAVNLCNLVVVVDTAHSDGLVWADNFHKMWQEAWPCRYGLAVKVPAAVERLRKRRTDPSGKAADLPWDQKTVSEKLALAIYTFDRAFGEYQAMIFWISLATRVTRERTWGDDVDKILRRQFEMIWQAASAEVLRVPNAEKARAVPSDMAWEQLVEGKGWTSEAAKRIRTQTAWLDSKGIVDFNSPVAFINGKQVLYRTATEQHLLQPQCKQMLLAEQRRLMDAVYFGRISDGDNVEMRMLQMAGSLTRWNPSVIDPASKEHVLLHALVQDPDYAKLVPRFVRATVESFKGADEEQEEEATAGGAHAVTHLAVCNLDSPLGRRLAAESLRYLSERLPTSPSARVLLLLNPELNATELEAASPTLLEATVHLALQQTTQFSAGVQEPDNKVTLHAVADFLSRLLANEALASRLAEPLSADAFDEETRKPLLNIAKKAQVDAPSIKKGLTKLMTEAKQGDLSEGLRVTPTQQMVALRKAHARMGRQALDIPAGASALITNGRVVATYPASQSSSARAIQVLVAEDLDLLTSIATTYQPAQAVASLVQEAFDAGRLQLPSVANGQMVPTADIIAGMDDVVAAAMAAMAVVGKVEEGPESAKQLKQALGFFQGTLVQLEPPASAAGPSGLHITCVVDPLTRTAQRISQVLSLLRASPLAPSIQLVLNPQQVVAELPLTASYRYALPDLATGDDALTTAPGAPSATFTRLTSKQVLSLSADAPEAWVVNPISTQYDLNELRLSSTPAAVRAELELSALTITGTCIDSSPNTKNATAALGLQLQLGTASNPAQHDTTVVLDSGLNTSSTNTYFQLQAAPGRWLVSLAPGASRGGFKMLSVSSAPHTTGAYVASSSTAQDAEPALSTRSVQVTVSSLRGKHVALRLRKLSKPNKELEGDNTQGKDAAASVVHVYSVASGHAEERLQRAMMASVMQHTKSPVKFWLVSNLASGLHKQVVPALAKKLGFEFEFVTYRWPVWLPKPVSKAQVVRAYKMLLLDVVLPVTQSLDRVVVLDADLVLRADVAQLATVDLKSQPFGFVPQCDSAPGMEYYQFWNNPFWSAQLKGKPFYSGSVAVVDLPRLRAEGAGDALRLLFVQQGGNDDFTAAPLDQTLPSFAQHKVGVQALPKEWAWCGAWCSKAGQSKAKAIAACANPKVQESRAGAGLRLLADWSEYDTLQAEVAKAVEAELGLARATEEAAAQSPPASKAAQQQQEEPVDGMQLPDVLSEAVPKRGSVGKDEL